MNEEKNYGDFCARVKESLDVQYILDLRLEIRSEKRVVHVVVCMVHLDIKTIRVIFSDISLHSLTDETTNLLATCGGKTVCIIDVNTQQVLKRFQDTDRHEVCFFLYLTFSM